MWCERVWRNCGNTDLSEGPGKAIDFVDLEWNERAGLLKKQSRSGEHVRVMLPRGQRLQHGDVIFEDANRAVIVNVVPCEVIVAQAARANDMAIAALELGNLHLPVQIGNNEIVFIEDEAALEIIESLQIPWRKEIRRFEPNEIKSAPGAILANAFCVVRRRR